MSMCECVSSIHHTHRTIHTTYKCTSGSIPYVKQVSFDSSSIKTAGVINTGQFSPWLATRNSDERTGSFGVNSHWLRELWTLKHRVVSPWNHGVTFTRCLRVLVLQWLPSYRFVLCFILIRAIILRIYRTMCQTVWFHVLFAGVCWFLTRLVGAIPLIKNGVRYIPLICLTLQHYAIKVTM